MGQLTVNPGSLETAAALLRAAHDDGATLLARAIVDDVQRGLGVEGGNTCVAGGVLPQAIEFVREQTETLSAHLDTAAGAYRRTEWLVRVALVEQS
ncbi:MAG TPA: hypothetical protein VG502_12880 [Flexivirga sp.]|uniref:hypothetical protein n=1 Tax=Flexivirga sp. TaxID=1962927 RepID=UPI002BB9FBC5|nr:hypothetical protein [Flexivirga sp.]HWC23187.1 hypothetical protein [Flexivirga sp.]